MRRRKIKIFLVIMFLLLMLIALMIFILFNNSVEKADTRTICQTIGEEIDNNDDLVIFIGNYSDASNMLESLQKEYSNLKGHNIIINDANSSCLKELLEENGIYEMIINSIDTSMIVYKKGVYQGVYVGVNNYEVVKDYLEEVGLIEFVSHNDIDLNDFKNKIKGNNYLLVLIVTENLRSDLEEKMGKFYKEYDYDIVNISEKEGRKIYNFISDDYEIDNEFPRLLWFNKGKLIENDFVIRNDDFSDFKNNIEN